MYEIPIAFIPISFTDVFETKLFSVSQINQAFISCVQLGKGYYYGIVAYSNPIISLSVILHGTILPTKLQKIKMI